MNNETGEIKILLVDDHQLMRQGLRQLISNIPGMNVVGEACNGQEALTQIKALTPDLVLMDIHLSDESGVEITRRALADCPSLKVLALSSDAELQLVLEALQAGVAGYIVKQNDSDELVRAIRAVMDHRLYLSPELSSAVIRDFMKSPSGMANTIKVARTSRVLSDRERLLLQLVAQGKRNKEIAECLEVAVKSAETYRSRLMKKLGCGSTAELVRYAIREGIVEA